MFIVEESRVTMEACEGWGSAWHGTVITGVADAPVKNCTIRDNGHWGVALYDAAATTFESCEVRSNARGSLGNHTGRAPTIRASRLQ